MKRANTRLLRVLTQLGRDRDRVDRDMAARKLALWEYVNAGITKRQVPNVVRDALLAAGWTVEQIEDRRYGIGAPSIRAALDKPPTDTEREQAGG